MRLQNASVALMTLYLVCACSSQSTDTDAPNPPSSSETTPETPEATRSTLDGWVPPECNMGLMAIAGEDACVTIGQACPDGRWATPSGHETDVLYVEPEGVGDGTSPDTPMGSLQTAIEQIREGGTIFLGAGIFSEQIQLTRPVNLRGLCSTKTILKGTADPQATVTLDGASASISNLRIESGAPAIELHPNSHLELSGVHLWQSLDSAIFIHDGASAHLYETHIQQVEQSAESAALYLGTAIIHQGSQLKLERVSLESCAASAIFVENAPAELSQVFMRANASKVDGGFTVESVGSPVTLVQDTVIEASYGTGLGSFIGGDLTLSNTVIRSGEKQGLVTAAMENVAIDHLTVQDNKSIGWVIIGSDMQISANHIFVEDTGPDDENDTGCDGSSGKTNPGYGIVQFSGELTLSTFEITGNSSAGLVLFDSANQDGFLEIFRGTPLLRASHGLITDNLIGVNIQINDFDLDAAFDNVSNFGNTAQDLSLEYLDLPSYGQLQAEPEEEPTLPGNEPEVVEVCPDELICLGLGGPTIGLCTTQSGELPTDAPRCQCSPFCGCEEPCPTGMDCIDMEDSGPYEQAAGTCATMCSNPIEGGPGGPGGPSGENPWSQFGACDPELVCNPFVELEEFACTTRCGGSLPEASNCGDDTDCQSDHICLPHLGTCAPLCDPETQYPAYQPDANGCISMFQNDGGCDEFQNNAQCDWDGGDCCESTCTDCVSACGAYGYNCLDPSAQ